MLCTRDAYTGTLLESLPTTTTSGGGMVGLRADGGRSRDGMDRIKAALSVHVHGAAATAYLSSLGEAAFLDDGSCLTSST